MKGLRASHIVPKTMEKLWAKGMAVSKPTAAAILGSPFNANCSLRIGLD